MRALVVDDNDQIVDVLSFLLESNNVDFETVNNGKEALNRLYDEAKENFDIIFLDLAMPEMSGFEVVEQLYAKDKIKDKKVVVITALELPPEDEKNLLEKGVSRVLKKPILVEDVEKLLMT
ncbi:MAG TPA: response regulator [Candidatus Saccharimonadales bacterium]|nr:response regulator [Candidatus Saccharimonadales bacterium]